MNNGKKNGKMHIVGGILGIMSGKEKGKIALLAVLGLLRSLAETVSTGAVLPYMYVLLDPDRASGLPVLRGLSRAAGGDGMKFILWSTLLFLALYALRCAYLVFYDYVDGRIIRRISSDCSVRLFQWYLARPYEYFFRKNTSLLQRNVSSVISCLMQGVISNGLYLVSGGLTVVLLLGFMVFSGVPGLLPAALGLGILYFLLSRDVKKRAGAIAGEANRHSKNLHRTVMECFRGIKDFKLSGDGGNITGYVSGEYDAANALWARRRLVGSIPSQILELGTVAILAVILIGGYRSGGMEESLAQLSLCGASAIRIRAALSGILGRITAIRDNSAFYEDIIDDIRASVQGESSAAGEEPVKFDECIEIRDLSYRYPNTETDIFRGFDLVIRKGESVGISGHSGRGKTTLADLLTGLIEPDAGEILIDGVPLKGREESWRKIVGYVPQEIFLIDGTVLDNIAFYEPAEKVDRERARKALRTAQILDFVDSLPAGEDSRIGENGILLSGGQRQRIGIARALYRNPQVLLFDEATNSLDSDTEKAFMDTIGSLQADYTTIVISHSKETLERCGRTVEL